MIDLKKIKKIYFIGIKGVAMAGLAIICKQRGLEVRGSDVNEKFITDDSLRREGITVNRSFDQSHLDYRPDLVVVGTSWGSDNPEVIAAARQGITTISDAELRGLLSREKKTIAVTGVHGKTTTTALLAHLFSCAGLRPSFLVGTGTVLDLPCSACWGAGEDFIVEGDEYSRSSSDTTPKFLDLDPYISVITSVEWEHVDIFKNVQAIESAFSRLIDATRELVVACGDWPSVRTIAAGHDRKVASYGLADSNLWQAYDIVQEFDRMVFKVKKDRLDIDEFSIRLLGSHNVSNALSCIIVALKVGIELETIREALASFSGTQRRFDVTESNGVTFIDDYGHHPSEIKATLQTVRRRYPDRSITCVFQPHMASRTKALLNDFARCFNDVNRVLVVDIFASAREQAYDITAKDLTAAIAKQHPAARYSGSIAHTTAGLQNELTTGDVIVTMGAGNVYEVRDALLAK